MRLAEKKKVQNLTMAISPAIHSLISRTKKSMFGLPMPIDTIDMGVPLKRPVIVKNPRSDDRTNGFGFLSKKDAIPVALEGDPTVICNIRRRQKINYICILRNLRCD